MAIISPIEIAQKAKKAYPRFLKLWVRGEEEPFFPWRARAKLAPDAKNPTETIKQVDRLLATSKANVGWGYTVHRERRDSRTFGSNDFPSAVTVDTLKDLLRLAKAEDDFAATQKVVARVRSELPRLEDWLQKHVNSLAKHAPHCDGLIAVTKFFLANPWPDCYARQIPVAVHTKFIDEYQAVLKQWLDLLLPDSAIDVNETKFARRFGLRDGDPHRAMRLLDPTLRSEIDLPFDELSLPIRLMAKMTITNATVFVVENDLPLLTLPGYPRGVALRGRGASANQLSRVSWLASNPIYYWGDIDVEGFWILSRLRNLLPQVTSLMMDVRTFERHAEYAGDGTGAQPSPPTTLTESEAEMYARCASENLRLEQEKILQPYVDETLTAWAAREKI